MGREVVQFCDGRRGLVCRMFTNLVCLQLGLNHSGSRCNPMEDMLSLVDDIFQNPNSLTQTLSASPIAFSRGRVAYCMCTYLMRRQLVVLFNHGTNLLQTKGKLVDDFRSSDQMPGRLVLLACCDTVNLERQTRACCNHWQNRS